MDYDENDFQSQNLHLTGEESAKFSPVLRPYALPKFEFDDTLQGHLRFDSLVETEDFLGIESNEDNQWIEDFSRGNSGIEFSSSAAESCTIARRNNVWSEATSSESVEMLLKSVGQEEIIPVPVQASAQESVVCDELGILAKQMEPSLKHDDNISSRIEDATDLQPALLEDEIPENFSKLKDDAVEEHHVVEDPSQTYKCDIISSDQDPNAVSENCSLPMADGSLSTDGKCENVDQSHITSLLDEFQENRMLEHASTMETQVDNVISSAHNIITTCGGSSNQELGHAINDISDQQGSSLQAVNGEVGELSGPDKSEAEIGVNNRDESPFLATKVEFGKEPNAGNSSLNDVEEHSSMIVKQGSNLSIVEGCSNAECSEEPMKGDKYENVVLHSGKEGEDQPDITVQNVSQLASEGDGIEDEVEVTAQDEVEVTALETSSVALKDDVKFEKHVIEFSSSKAVGFASLEPQMDSLAQTHGHNNFAMDKEVSVVRGCEMGSKDIVSSSNASLLSMEDNKFSEGAVSSAKLHQETCRTETLKCANSALGVCNELLNTEHHSLSSTNVESTEICEEKIIPVQVDVQNSNLDVCGHGLDKKEFSSHSHVDKEVVSSSSGIFSTDNKVAAMNLHSDTGIVNNSEITLEHSNNAACMKVDSVPSFSENVVTSDGGQNQSERSPPVLGLTHLDKKEDEKEEAVNRRSTETSEIGLDSETVKRQLLSETGDLSNVERQDEFETAAGNEVRQECSKELETHPVLIESIEKECDAPKTVLEKSEDITLKENYEKTTLKDSDAKIIPREDKMLMLSGPSSLEITCGDVDHIASEEKEATVESGDKVCEKTALPDTEGEGGNRYTDSDKPTCGSPTVIRAVQPSQSEKKEGVMDLKGNDSSKSDTSFTFEVSPLASLSKKESGSSQPISTVSSANVSMIVEGSPSVAGFSQQKPKVTQDKSRGSPKVSDGETVRGSAKGTTERKPRRATPKGPGKETSKKRNLTKEGTPTRKSEKGEKPSVVSLSSSVIGQLIPSNAVQLLTTTASLPDLNSSASPPSVFQQPFTDSQQVQLRTQIFVYGSLIQGVAPDEAYMISAFGGPDGGRSIWESAWRTALERSRSLKSPSVNPETPLPPRSGAKASNQAVKQSGTQTKGIATPAGRASSKGTPSNIVNPMIPLSSPLWSISTPGDAPQSIAVPRGSVMDYQPALSPLRPYQTPPVRNFAAHNTWLSQPSFRGPWVASPQPSPVDTSARFPLLPNMEPVQLTPVKEQSGTHSSGIMHVSPGPMVHSGDPTGVFPGNAPQMDLMKVTASPGQHTSDTKPRKRKKVSNSEDSCQNVFPSQSQTEPLSAPGVSHLSGSFTISTPTSLVPKPTTEKVIMPVSPVSSTDHRKIGERHPEPTSVLSENFAKVKEAKLHAEEAAALSASAVNHCQTIWSRLDEQKNTGLASDVEAKLASAAVAVAAAASVAKAAAAAAKVAHDAALQANLIADEALSSSSYGNPNQNTVFSASDSMNISTTSTPVSIMRGDDGTNNSTSIIVAAKEAARRRVEAASAASKRAENLDAIVKAAELAAEAVSQAGKIVCMGDPLPLKELVEHGPAGYWKVPQVSFDLVVKSKNVNAEQLHEDIAGEDLNISSKHSEEPSAGKETLTTNHANSTTLQEVSTESKEDHIILVDGITSSTTASEKKSKVQKGRKVSDMSKTAGVIPESDIRPGSTPVHVYNRGEKGVQSSRDGSSIKEGSQVEVFKNDERFKAAWYPANVLSLQDGKAFVGYKELISDEGPVKEWVALEGEGNESPVIRLARRPMGQFEGTRKRRRVAMGDYCWSVGDRVDAFIQDSWWEGVITEKDKKDETSFTVQFPAQNKTSVVREWNLRRSLIWKDGEWVELSSIVAKDSTSFEGDTPQEKRLKMTTAEVEIKDMDEISKRNDAEPGKTEEPRLPGLSTNDKVFNIGKNTKDENRPGTLRTARTGLQKEGSRVVFGVPKPGKKRKFMEVSKHYVGDQARKANEAKDSAKISKYLMPQGSGSRGWRNNSKTDLKEKRVAESKLKAGIPGKSNSVSSRTLRKNDHSAATVSASDSGTVSDNQAQIRDSIEHVENASGKDKTMEFGSLSTNGEGPISYPSVPQQSSALPSKKAGTSDAKSERANKGKLAPIVAGGRLPKIDEVKVSSGKATKSVSEIVEPRRSVRRIQPTSRLLEGLQSSLIISKIPSFSHDRNHKNKSASRANNNG